VHILAIHADAFYIGTGDLHPAAAFVQFPCIAGRSEKHTFTLRFENNAVGSEIVYLISDEREAVGVDGTKIFERQVGGFAKVALKICACALMPGEDIAGFDSAHTLLEAHKRLQEERKRLMGESYIDSDYVCTWNNGKLISPNYLTSQFNKIIKNSTFPPIRLHDLRHSTAINLLNRGLSVVQDQERLGHSSAATTLNFYAHADKTSKQAVADAMQSMIEIPSRIQKC